VVFVVVVDAGIAHMVSKRDGRNKDFFEIILTEVKLTDIKVDFNKTFCI
jgi:type VI protein secretion system component Hcp